MTITPYSTVEPFLDTRASWVPALDQDRIASYVTYESIYWNVPEAFKLEWRGDEDKSIYVPAAMTVCDATAHYLLKGLEIAFGTPGVNPQADLDLKNFLKKESFKSRFGVAKHSGVVRGEWLMHITADPDAEPLSRISMTSVDPAQYFPVYNADNLDVLEAVHLVDQTLVDGEIKLRRTTYRYEWASGVAGKGPRTVIRSEAIFKVDKDSFQLTADPEAVVLPEEPLPPEITTIPVYQFRNRDWQGEPHGSSELRGFENLIRAVNQAVSDQDLALALQGLGVYATDSPPPVDSSGQPVPWQIAPARVVELPAGKKFDRIPGLDKIDPSLDHIKFLLDTLYEGSSTFRGGAVEVSVAESGIALAIRFSPMLAKIEERDDSGLDKLSQMWFDWQRWYKIYEGPDYTALEIVPTLGDKLPTDRTAAVNELLTLVDKKLVSKKWAMNRLADLGYEFDPTLMEQEILAETSAAMDAVDLAGNRVNNELDSGDGGEPGSDGGEPVPGGAEG